MDNIRKQGSDAAGLIYKTHHNEPRTAQPPFTKVQVQVLSMFVSDYLHQKLTPLRDEIGVLRREIETLRADAKAVASKEDTVTPIRGRHVA